MHDIDGIGKEYESEAYEMETHEPEYAQEYSQEITSPFPLEMETALASELLSIVNEQELDHFIGNLISSAGNAVGGFIRSPTGRALGGILKDAARKSLPVVGGAIGGYFGGQKWAERGSKFAPAVGQFLGLELEGISPENLEFEAAKRFVRFGGAAAVKLIRTPKNIPVRAAVRQAATEAACRYLPGLISTQPDMQRQSMTGYSGRWIRRGRKIVLYGL